MNNFTLIVNQTFPPPVPPPVLPAINITLLLPLNNSVDTDGRVIFEFYTNVSGLADLIIDNLINQSKNVSAGNNAFSEIIFISNATIEWYVNLTSFNITQNSEIWLLNLNITEPAVITDIFSVTTCPNTLANVGLYFVFILIALFFVFVGFAYKIGVFGFLGSLLLMILSWFLFACLFLFALALLLFSLFMALWFLLSGLGLLTQQRM